MAKQATYSSRHHNSFAGLICVNPYPNTADSVLSPQALILLESSPNTCSFLGQGCNLQKDIGRESDSMN